MLRRPKPTDSETDLLREQQKFLSSGAPSAANVIRRPDKRRGEAGVSGGAEGERGQLRENRACERDVVTIDGMFLGHYYIAITTIEMAKFNPEPKVSRRDICDCCRSSRPASFFDSCSPKEVSF